MTIDKSLLKALAEKFPQDLDFDGNDVPFSLHPEYGVVGGEADGTYSVFGKPFRLEGEDYDYDGPTYVEQCSKEFAQFMVSAREGVLALLEEVERLERKNANQSESIREYQDLAAEGDRLGDLRADLRVTTGERDDLKAENESLKGSCKAMGKDMAKVTRERNAAKSKADQLKVENEALRKDAERYRWFRASGDPDIRYLDSRGSIWPEALDEEIDAAMAKEGGHD